MDLRARYVDNPVLAELYDLVPGYGNRPDRDFYLRSAAAAAGKILELGCGTGRILIPIAESGHAITGVDSSEHMLSKCRQKLNSLPGNIADRVRLIKGDMACLMLDDVFHQAIIPFRAFQHLIRIEDQLACLSTLNRHLVMNARLIFDVVNVDFGRINNPDLSEEIEDLPEYGLQDGRRLRRTGRMARFHRAEQYNEVELIYYLTDVDGSTARIVQAFPFRYFFRYEIQHLLERCGFRVIELLGDFGGAPLSHDSPDMIFVAEKHMDIR
jgi:ubiquinone/menaquinone biosynthesis C-methylase UbiE